MTQTIRLEGEQIRRLEWLSIIESSTLVLLVCVAVPLKHVFGWPMGSKVMGPIHGIAFLIYIWTALQTVASSHWRAGDTARLLLVAIFPFAGYFNVRWLRERARLLDEGRLG